MTFFFTFVLAWLIGQRLLELRAARQNTARLIANGAVEFGQWHYPLIVALHVAFFVSLIFEFLLRRPLLPQYWWLAVILFVVAQMLRFWVRETMGRRWTTRVIVLRTETLVSNG